MQSFPGETLAVVDIHRSSSGMTMDDGSPFVRIDDACFAAKRDAVPK